MKTPDREPAPVPQERSVFARLAVPYSFNPDLPPALALFAVIGTLVRIFSACLFFAVWGGFSALAWNAVGNRFLRGALLVPLILLFLAGLTVLMLGISAIENKIFPK